jgi:myosin heavy subunit
MDTTSSNETLHTSKELERLIAEIKAVDAPADKLKLTIELMEFALSQKGQPDFKVFWNARESCLDLFKEDIPPAIRAAHWQKYRELTQQARLLKDHFEEESSFALEQIEKAIEAIENEVKDLSKLVADADLSDFPKLFPPVQQHRGQYLKLQKELNFLNAYASRINALRKEVVSTKMRMRKKNRFFERLSSLGNQVFPRRKELIEELSRTFSEDVDQYIQQRFAHLSTDRSPHIYREEIKTLQAVAKILSLNGKSFSETRRKLSECWDKVKEVDKQRKKDYDVKKEAFAKNTEEIRNKINQYKEEFSSDEFSAQEAQQRIEEISKAMRNVELGREDVRLLREEIVEAKKPLMEKMKQEEAKRRQAQLEKEEQKQTEIRNVQEQVDNLHSSYAQMSSKDLLEKLSLLKATIDSLQISDFEKQSLLRSLVIVEDEALHKQDQEESLPENPEELKVLLQIKLRNKRERRKVIKASLDDCRKACGASGLDFEQSMLNNQLLNLEKERMEKISREIQTIEQQLSAL